MPRIALDMDTALEDEQWSKLKDFLSDKLEDDDMDTVEHICRRGGDAPEKKPRPGPMPGASDAAARAARTHQDDVRKMHRAGLIGDAQLEAELLQGPNTATRAPISKPTYDAAAFPHSSRLK